MEGIKQNYRALGGLLAGNVTGTAAAETVSTAIDSKLAEATAALSRMAAVPDATLLISYPYRMATGDTLEGQLLARWVSTAAGRTTPTGCTRKVS